MNAPRGTPWKLNEEWVQGVHENEEVASADINSDDEDDIVGDKYDDLVEKAEGELETAAGGLSFESMVEMAQKMAAEQASASDTTAGQSAPRGS